MYFFNDNFLDIKNVGVREGGVVRNIAWIKFLKNNYPSIKFINFKISNKILKYCNYIFFYIKCSIIKNDKVFFLYPKVGLPILAYGKKGKLFRKLFLISLKNLIKNNNELIFDISDIKYEQAIDLEIDNLDLEEVKAFEKEFFSMRQKYIFASYSMREYIQKLYKINDINTDVCINGGHPVLVSDISFNSRKNDKIIRFVYAGTLNKGRMIEQMINVFPNENRYELLLLGISGEWITEYLEENKKTNVKYMGAYEENDAKIIVSQCDIGLIPYDDSRMYYNIAYPTKLSFYITAGIPFLSTPVKEVEIVLSKFDIGYSANISDWKKVIYSFTSESILEKKSIVDKEKHNFYWDEIFSKCKFIDNN